MNKYLVYRWSPVYRSYRPLISFPTLSLAKYAALYAMKHYNYSCIVIRNPHSRYADDSE